MKKTFSGSLCQFNIYKLPQLPSKAAKSMVLNMSRHEDQVCTDKLVDRSDKQLSPS